MPDYILEILKFGWAVLNNWAGYMTGGIIAASVGFWFFRHDIPIPRKLSWILAILFLGVAIFNAWRDQYKQVQALQKRFASPEMTGPVSFNMKAPASIGGKDTMVILGLVILNPHGPPAAIDEWKGSIRLPDSHIINAALPASTNQEIRFHAANRPNEFASIRPENSIIRIANSPIVGGGKAEGWLMVAFHGMTMEQINATNGVFVVSFTDAMGGSHTVEGPVYAPDKTVTMEDLRQK